MAGTTGGTEVGSPELGQPGLGVHVREAMMSSLWCVEFVGFQLWLQAMVWRLRAGKRDNWVLDHFVCRRKSELTRQTELERRVMTWAWAGIHQQAERLK